MRVLVNQKGNVIGMMPHPEAFLSLYNHPNWGKLREIIQTFLKLVTD